METTRLVFMIYLHHLHLRFHLRHRHPLHLCHLFQLLPCVNIDHANIATVPFFSQCGPITLSGAEPKLYSEKSALQWLQLQL